MMIKKYYLLVVIESYFLSLYNFVGEGEALLSTLGLFF